MTALSKIRKCIRLICIVLLCACMHSITLTVDIYRKHLLYCFQRNLIARVCMRIHVFSWSLPCLWYRHHTHTHTHGTSISVCTKRIVLVHWIQDVDSYCCCHYCYYSIHLLAFTYANSKVFVYVTSYSFISVLISSSTREPDLQVGQLRSCLMY